MAQNSPRAMDIVSVRFSADQIDLITEEAEHNGVARSQFIRDAAYAKAVLSNAERNAQTVRMWNAMSAFVKEYGTDALAAVFAGLSEERASGSNGG